MSDDHDDTRGGLDDDEPDEPDDVADRPGYAFTVTARPASGHGSVDIIDLSDIDWANLIPAALAADTVADFERLPFPAGFPDVARRAVAVWCRHPTSTNGMLNWQGTYIVGESGTTRPATDDDPGDALSFELIGGTPYYPQHEYPDRPVTAIVTAMRAAMGGVDPYSIDDVADWWPHRIVVDRRTPDRRPWIDIDDRNGRPISHTRLGHDRDRNAPQHTTPIAPTTTRGRPLATLDHDDVIAVVVEAMRRRKTPGHAPPGRPPSTASVIASLTPRERLAAACEAVEHHHMPQARAAARALDVRPDSLNRAIKRRRRRS